MALVKPLFPGCALTGFVADERIPDPSNETDRDLAGSATSRRHAVSASSAATLSAGSRTGREESLLYNALECITPDREAAVYPKRHP